MAIENSIVSAKRKVILKTCRMSAIQEYLRARKSDCHKTGPDCARESLRDGRDSSRRSSSPSSSVKHKQAPTRFYGTRLQIHFQFTVELFIEIHTSLKNTNASKNTRPTALCKKASSVGRQG